MKKKSDLLRDQENPSVLGYPLDKETLTPKQSYVDLTKEGDYGADPLPSGQFRMVPSGDIVNLKEMRRRLKEYER